MSFFRDFVSHSMGHYKEKKNSRTVGDHDKPTHVSFPLYPIGLCRGWKRGRGGGGVSPSSPCQRRSPKPNTNQSLNLWYIRKIEREIFFFFLYDMWRNLDHKKGHVKATASFGLIRTAPSHLNKLILLKNILILFTFGYCNTYQYIS